jgi:hypothetical protein
LVPQDVPNSTWVFGWYEARISQCGGGYKIFAIPARSEYLKNIESESKNRQFQVFEKFENRGYISKLGISFF